MIWQRGGGEVGGGSGDKGEDDFFFRGRGGEEGIWHTKQIVLFTVVMNCEFEKCVLYYQRYTIVQRQKPSIEERKKTVQSLASRPFSSKVPPI